MELKVAGLREDFLELDTGGVDFSVLDSLKTILNEDQRIEYAGVNLTHPLTRRIRFIVKSKGNVDVMIVVKEGIDKLMKLSNELSTLIGDTLGRS
ncbi:MAG: hypothetical protein NZ920_03655 [Aigarchaeota archaeon]|nr:hypothetical protein [Aigarchaeota archaeon]MDW8092284.1 RpoL/Rpb11 RNA polymerase subunit family protein [Nitrososphaerota archaeon]